MTDELQRCTRCHVTYTTAPYLMAGRKFCCQSCSVGSACEHQGIHRATNVRRYDTNFDRFRQVARESNPYEVGKAPHAG
ncbi:MAG: hypothetical protein IPH65_13230 [Dehalococcoidia bacterium]|uniref:hypothetical protein n=1 Tax=Candidatus Amarobacter glycogenicus TaxID=3140699 RepID=UPI003136DAD1|nr:hypothetical protein [Dehalococcoidia bacterium]